MNSKLKNTVLLSLLLTIAIIILIGHPLYQQSSSITGKKNETTYYNGFDREQDLIVLPAHCAHTAFSLTDSDAHSGPNALLFSVDGLSRQEFYKGNKGVSNNTASSRDCYRISFEDVLGPLAVGQDYSLEFSLLVPSAEGALSSSPSDSITLPILGIYNALDEPELTTNLVITVDGINIEFRRHFNSLEGPIQYDPIAVLPFELDRWVELKLDFNRAQRSDSHYPGHVKVFADEMLIGELTGDTLVATGDDPTSGGYLQLGIVDARLQLEHSPTYLLDSVKLQGAFLKSAGPSTSKAGAGSRRPSSSSERIKPQLSFGTSEDASLTKPGTLRQEHNASSGGVTSPKEQEPAKTRVATTNLDYSFVYEGAPDREKILNRSCNTNGLISGTLSHETPRSLEVLVESECFRWQGSVVTFEGVPDLAKVSGKLEVLRNQLKAKNLWDSVTGSKKKFMLTAMFSEATPIGANAVPGQKYFNSSGEQVVNIEESELCGAGRPFGANFCVPNFANEKVRAHFLGLAKRLIDLGFRDFLFAQLAHLDTPCSATATSCPTTNVQRVINDIRSYAQSKGKTIIVGAQPNDLYHNSYMGIFDYLDGAARFDRVGSFRLVPKTVMAVNEDRPERTELEILHPSFRATNARVLVEVDWHNEDDDIHRIASLAPSRRRDAMYEIHKYVQSLDGKVGFVFPFLNVYNHNHTEATDRTCYGISMYAYTAYNKPGAQAGYTCCPSYGTDCDITSWNAIMKGTYSDSSTPSADQQSSSLHQTRIYSAQTMSVKASTTRNKVWLEEAHKKYKGTAISEELLQLYLPMLTEDLNSRVPVRKALKGAAFPLTVSISGLGSVASTPAGISCNNGACSAIFDPNVGVSLSAVPSAGQIFSGWQGACSGPQGICTVVMTGAKVVTASFVSSSDTVAPTVSISSPVSGTTYSSAQTVTISASATDNVGVSKVEFYRGSTLVSTDTSSPYSASWAISTANNGTHSWKAKAYDAAGNTKESSAVSLTVDIPTTLSGFMDKLYYFVMNRAADSGGKQYFLNMFTNSGCNATTFKTVVGAFYDSTEFKDRNLSAQDYVISLYRSVLAREPDPSGLSYWTSQKQGGATTTTMVSGFVDTTEFSTRMATLCN